MGWSGACGELALVESFSKMPYFRLGGLSNETRKRRLFGVHATEESSRKAVCLAE